MIPKADDMELDLAHLARPRRLARSEPDLAPKKKCRCCKSEKRLSAFAGHPLAKDGLRRDCRACVKSDRTKRDPKKSAAKTRNMRRRRRDNPKIQARNRIAVAEWTNRNPQATRARKAVSRAIKRGELKKAPRCQIRGCSMTRIEAHHADYHSPMSVLWACRSHHRRLHSGEVIPLKAYVDPRLARIPRELAA